MLLVLLLATTTAQWIFVFNESATKLRSVETLATIVAAEGNGTVDRVFSKVIKGFATSGMTEEDAAVAAKNPNVAFYEPDYIATALKAPVQLRTANSTDNGAVVVTQQQLDAMATGGYLSSGDYRPWGINRVNSGNSYSGSKKAYVIDTGIADHSDLNKDESFGWTAYWRRVNFWDYVPTYDDGDGHGTHVAGTIAAKYNGFGVTGVAPGAKVVPIKVLDDNGSGSYSTVIAGIDYVASTANRNDVACLSLGGPYSAALNAAVENAASQGIKMVVAAGNEATDAASKSPASASGNGVYTISAIDDDDDFASFSNYGNPVDYACPGVSIVSTYLNNQYAWLSGTSMAAPHAAGILLRRTSIQTDGFVNSGDPDGNPDPICSV